MLSVQQDSYNRQITQQQISKFYKVFKKLLLNNQPLQSKIHEQQSLNIATLSGIKSKIPQKQQKIKTLSSENLSDKIYSQSLTENSLYKIINIDCLRTRSINFNQEIKKNLQYLITYFVKINKIQYKQGLNQIAAPFVIFTQIGVPISQCYQMFEKFFLRFSLNFYYDKDFNGLQMFLRMISIVLRYHSPSLSRYLQVYDIQPQIYALSWLMTLFSSKLSLQMTYLLWSYLIAQNDRYLLFFIVVGIIIRRKDSIIQTQNSSVFRIVTDMIFKNQQQLRQIIQISLVLRKCTPISLTTFFNQKQIFNRMQSYKQSAQLLDHINKLNLFLILPKQLKCSQNHQSSNCLKRTCMLCQHNHLLVFDNQQDFQETSLPKLIKVSNDIKKIRKNIQYVIIDIRQQKTKFNCQKLQKQVFSVNLNQPFQQIQTQFLDTYMQSLSSKHFILLLTTFTFQDFNFSDQVEFKCAQKFMKVLNSYSFPHLGILEGGFTALSIFQQELSIKNTFQKQKNIVSMQEIPYNVINSNEFSQIEKQLKQMQKVNLPINLLFEIAQLKYSHKLGIFAGIQKTLCFVTNVFVFIIQQKQNFLPFVTYLQHNCSIATYFFSNFKPISCRILKILPISKIKEIKYKGQNQNSIVLNFLSQKQTLNEKRTIRIDSIQNNNRYSVEMNNKINENLRKLLLAQNDVQYQNKMNESANLQKQNQKIKQDQKVKQQKLKKIIFCLKDKQTLKQMSLAIQNAYKLQLIKKHKNIPENQNLKHPNSQKSK